MGGLIKARTQARMARGLNSGVKNQEFRMFKHGQRVRFRFPDYRRYPTAGTVVSASETHVTVTDVPECGTVHFDLSIVGDGVENQRPPRRPRDRRRRGPRAHVMSPKRSDKIRRKNR